MTDIAGVCIVSLGQEHTSYFLYERLMQIYFKHLFEEGYVHLKLQIAKVWDCIEVLDVTLA